MADSERQHLDQLAHRLHGELRLIWNMVSDQERDVSNVSRKLGVNRATCSRVANTVRRPATGIDVLLNIPGVEGLREFVTAAEAQLGSPGVGDGANGAIDALEEAIRKYAGSLRRLRQRLRTNDGTDSGAASTHAAAVSDQEHLFNVSSQIVGASSDMLVVVRLLCPVPGAPDKIEGISCTGHVGHRSKPGALPFVMRQAQVIPSASDAGALKPGTAGLLESFCSPNLPRSTARQRSSNDYAYLSLILGEMGNEGTDVFRANRPAQPYPHPSLRSPAIGEAWAMIFYPTRHLLFDVYLHRALARTSVQSLDVQLWTPDIDQTPESRWTTRLPGGPQLKMLGTGIERAGCPAHTRHAELIQSLFEQGPWNPNDFVGYRCEETYPIWRAGYRFELDFSDSDSSLT